MTTHARRTPILGLTASVLVLAACTRAPAPCDPPGTQVAEPRAAGCVAVSGGALLMVRTEDGWSIPGGHVADGEETAAAAVRETREEAGVVVEAREPFCAVPGNRFVAHRCEVPGRRPAPRPDGVEAEEAAWMTARRIRSLSDAALRFPAQRPAYLRALGAGSDSTATRRRTGP